MMLSLKYVFQFFIRHILMHIMKFKRRIRNSQRQKGQTKNHVYLRIISYEENLQFKRYFFLYNDSYLPVMIISDCFSTARKDASESNDSCMKDP